MSDRTYPLPRPESGEDPRFTWGLAHDIGKRLEEAGYPPITCGADFVELQLALFRFLYAPEATAPAASLDDSPRSAV